MNVRLEPGTIVGGEFRVLRPLAEGGFGAVYEAEQRSTGVRRALKVLHPHFVTDPASRVRFVEEAKVGGRIPSDHVVQVVAAGVDEDTGIPYLAMELLEGEDLAARIARAGPLPPAQARTVFAQLGHALGAAHEHGIVHRDLKPENVFLARSRRAGEELIVKVLDFGIAKTLQAGRTAATATAAMGSPLFMAPEQAAVGASIRPSTDVWAIGLIAFHALSGVHYWRAAAGEPMNVQAIMAEALVHDLVPASERARELGAAALPEGFDAWFSRCVDRDPAVRFQSAASCLEVLDRVLTGQRVVVGSGPLGLADSTTDLAPIPAMARPIPRPESAPTAPGPPPAPPNRGSRGSAIAILLAASVGVLVVLGAFATAMWLAVR